MKYIYYFIFIVLLSHLFGIFGWIYSIGPRVLDVVAFSFVLFAIVNIHKIVKTKDSFKRLVLYLSLSLLLTVFLKLFFSKDSIQVEVQYTIVMSFTFISYYFLQQKRFSEKSIIWMITVFSLIVLFLQIYQNINREFMLFGFMESDEGDITVGKRNNMLRLYIANALMIMFPMYYYWGQLLKRFTISSLFFFLAFLSSMYFFLTRQLIVATILTIIFSLFIDKGKKRKWIAILLIIAGTVLIVIYFDDLFGEFLYETEHNTYSTDIRIQAVPYFLKYIFSDPIRLLWGNGHEQSILNYGMNRGWVSVDLGLIGDAFHYGIIWPIVYLLTSYKILFVYKEKIPLYIRLYVISTLIHCLMIAPYNIPEKALIWSFVLYISSLYLDKKRGYLTIDIKTNRIG